jgi:hypothetical protein
MADIKIADHYMIAMIAENCEGGRNGDAEPYCQEYNDSLPFHDATICYLFDNCQRKIIILAQQETEIFIVFSGNVETYQTREAVKKGGCHCRF